jgi:hypothetical protein
MKILLRNKTRHVIKYYKILYSINMGLRVGLMYNCAYVNHWLILKTRTFTSFNVPEDNEKVL